MTKSEEIKNLQRIIKSKDDEIDRLKADKNRTANLIKKHERMNETVAMFERSNDYLRGVIAKSNKGFGLHISKQA